MTAIVKATIRTDIIGGGTGMPWTIGQAFKDGDVTASQYVITDAPNTQVIPQNYWKSGCLKFAVISSSGSAIADTTGLTVSMSATNAAPVGVNLTEADLAATGVTASIVVGGIGTVNLQSLINTGTAFSGSGGTTWTRRTVFQGPQMSSFVYRSPVGADTELVAWFEVRIYAGGKVNIFPYLAMDYHDTPLNTNRSAILSVTVGTNTVYNSVTSKTVYYQQSLPLLSPTAFEGFWYGQVDPQIVPHHDTAYLRATKMVPNYYGTNPGEPAFVFHNNDTSDPWFDNYGDVFGPVYTITVGGSGNFRWSATDSGGYSPMIGPLPNWWALYITSNADARMWKCGMVNDIARGSFSKHFRNRLTNAPLKLADQPTLGNYYNPLVTGPGTANPFIDSWGSHAPAPSYMMWLLTGRFWAAEEVQTTHAGQQVYNGFYRQAGLGIINSMHTANQPRGAAWLLRSLGMAITTFPDADGSGVKADFVTQLSNNIDWYKTLFVDNGTLTVVDDGVYLGLGNTLGALGDSSNYDTSNGQWSSAIWQQCFLSCAINWLYNFECGLSSTEQSKLSALVSHVNKWPVGLMGTGVVGLPYTQGGTAYYITVGALGDSAHRTINYAASWEAVYTLNQTYNVGQFPPISVPVANGALLPSADPLGYHYAQPGMALGAAYDWEVKNSVVGGPASVAWTRFQSGSNYTSALSSQAASHPIWMIGPIAVYPPIPGATPPPPPPPPPPPVVGIPRVFDVQRRSSGNRVLEGAVVPAGATSYVVAGPVTAVVGVANTYTVTANAAYAGTVTVATTSGTLSKTTFSLPNSFTFTPTVAGTATLSFTNSTSLTNPQSIAVVSVAPTLTLTGPSTGTVSVATSAYTLGANGPITGTFTPQSSNGGSFTPASLSGTGTFTHTPASSGTYFIGLSNNAGLTNPQQLQIVVTNPGAPPPPPAKIVQVTGVDPSAAGASGIRGFVTSVTPSGKPGTILFTFGYSDATDPATYAFPVTILPSESLSINIPSTIATINPGTSVLVYLENLTADTGFSTPLFGAVTA